MNSLMREYYPTFEYYQAMRSQLMDILEDDDLAFTVGGENPSLGALCVEIGETQESYIESFKTLKQEFSYGNADPEVARTVSHLRTWYIQLDQQLKSALESFSEEDLRSRLVDRGGGFELPLHIQLDVYKEALLIFYGKVSVYLKAMGKERPQQWQEWIA
jgi:uncharacterized damage-inducible protein DinB